MQDADVIVIGSGAGGLGAALTLARTGKKVIVIEQHYVPGGWCHSFYEEGFRFSPGVHYIGQLGEGGSTRGIYEGLGLGDRLSFFRMDTQGFEQCQFGDIRIDQPAGLEDYIRVLQKRFPKEAKAIHKYLWWVRKAADEISRLGDVHNFWDMVTVPYRTRHLGRYGLFSLKRVQDWYFKDPLLKSVLAIQCGDHGLPPAVAPFPVHAGVMGHYLEGGYYPMGGGGALVKAFTRALRGHGAEIMTSTRVKKILTQGKGSKKRTLGVLLEDGRRIHAPSVVSNADPYQTFFELVGRENLSGKLTRKLDRTTFSVASLNLFLGVEANLRDWGMTSGNRWYLDRPDANAVYERMMGGDLFAHPSFPGMFISSPSLKDPTSAHGPHQSLEAVTFVDNRSFDRFSLKDRDGRSATYTDWKNRLLQKFRNTLEQALPGITERIVYEELGTPLTSQYYVQATMGNAYGTEKLMRQIGPRGYTALTEFDGLYLTGASTLSHGVSGATISGVETAAAMLKIPAHELLNGQDEGQIKIYEAEDPNTWSDAIHRKIASRNQRYSSEKQDGSNSEKGSRTSEGIRP